MQLTSSYKMLRVASFKRFAQQSKQPQIGQSGFDWSTVQDAQEQYEEAMRVLLDDPSEAVTAAAKKKPTKRKPTGLYQKAPITTEINRFQRVVNLRRAELAELRRIKADPKEIKKKVALLTRAKKDLADYKLLTRHTDWNTIEGLTKAAKEFLEKMGGDASYVDWYERHSDLVEERYGPDREWGGGPEKFYHILAALSPAKLVQTNTTLAMTAYRNWKLAMKAKDMDFTFTKKTAPGGAMKTHLNNLNRMLRDEEISGKKVLPFKKNLLGDVNEVTIDRWMGLIFFGTTTPNKKQTDFGKEVVRQIAVNMGKTPRYIQGLMWEMIMDRWGKPASDYKKAIEKSLQAFEERGVYTVTSPKVLKQNQKSRSKSAPIPPAASRRASVSIHDDPNEVARAVMDALGLSPEMEDEAPALFQASRTLTRSLS